MWGCGRGWFLEEGIGLGDFGGVQGFAGGIFAMGQFWEGWGFVGLLSVWDVLEVGLS